MSVLLLITLLPILAAQPDRFGEPACDAPHLERAHRTGFVLCHDSFRKVPSWTLYELTPQQLEAAARRRPSRFQSGPALKLPSAPMPTTVTVDSTAGIWFQFVTSPRLPRRFT